MFTWTRGVAVRHSPEARLLSVLVVDNLVGTRHTERALHTRLRVPDPDSPGRVRVGFGSALDGLDHGPEAGVVLLVAHDHDHGLWSAPDVGVSARDGQSVIPASLT